MTTTLITGLSRSGTSLACACLDTLPDCVALVEPMELPRHGDRARAVAEIVDFVAQVRARLLATRSVRAVVVDGAIPDNTFEEPRADGGLRRPIVRIAELAIDRKLTPGFRLFVKHPAIFTALIEPLLEHLPLYAVLRHPLAVLASWQSVDAPVRLGRWPMAEIYAPDLRDRLDGIAGVLPRQVALIGWVLRQFRALPPDRILTYEALLADPSAALRPLSGSDAPVTHAVHRFALRARYPAADLAALAEALLPIRADIEAFYPDFAASLRPFLHGPARGF